MPDKLDKVDKEIIDLLSVNSRLSVRDIAEKISVSPSTVSRKIRKLEQKDIIKGYVSIIDDEELGYGCRAVLLIKVSTNIDPTTVIDKIRTNDRICNLFLTVGNYDIVSTATCSNLEDLQGLVTELRFNEGIAWIDVSFIVSRHKVLNKVINQENDPKED